MTSPRRSLAASVRSGMAASRFALHGTSGGRDLQPTTSADLDTLRTAPAQLRQIMNDHHGQIAGIRQQVEANSDYTPEGRRNAIAAASKPIQGRTAAAVAGLADQVDAAHSALQQQSAAMLPKPAAGVEGMLGRQAAWSRAQTLLAAGMTPRNLINETSDPDALHSLADELPTYLRAQGVDQDAAQAITGSILDRLAEVAGEPTASARLAAREADVHHAGLQPLLRQAGAEATGQAAQGTGVGAAVAAQLARQQVANAPTYTSDDQQSEQSAPAGTLRANIANTMRNAARAPRQTTSDGDPA